MMTRVCVLLSTFNGEKYIKEQLCSLLEQEDVDITILIRDDGSKDNTIQIINQIKDNRIYLYSGDNIGPANSFMDLIYKSPEADYYAFCDQDDIWMPNKLQAAIHEIEKIENVECKRMFYFSNVLIADANLDNVTKSDICQDFINIKQRLLHNCAIGCTSVFNKNLRNKVKEYNPNYIFMHDWWVYLVCLATNGEIIFDSNAYVYYRQHDNNAVGFQHKHRSLKQKIFIKPECEPKIMAHELLCGYSEQMNRENYESVYILANYTNDIKCKVKLLKDKGFYQGTKREIFWEKIAIMRNRK